MSSTTMATLNFRQPTAKAKVRHGLLGPLQGSGPPESCGPGCCSPADCAHGCLRPQHAGAPDNCCRQAVPRAPQFASPFRGVASQIPGGPWNVFRLGQKPPSARLVGDPRDCCSGQRPRVVDNRLCWWGPERTARLQPLRFQDSERPSIADCHCDATVRRRYAARPWLFRGLRGQAGAKLIPVGSVSGCCRCCGPLGNVDDRSAFNASEARLVPACGGGSAREASHGNR